MDWAAEGQMSDIVKPGFSSLGDGFPWSCMMRVGTIKKAER